MKICVKFANSIVSGTLHVNPKDAVGDVIELIRHGEQFRDDTSDSDYELDTDAELLSVVPDYELVTDAGKMLDRGSTLESCGVEDGNILFALDVGPFEISIHPSNSWSFRISAQSTDTVRSLKEKIHSETKKQMEANYIRARAELVAIVGDEENIETAVLPRDMIYWRRWYRRIKDQLPDLGIPSEEQCLTYRWCPLEDDEKCLWYYGIVTSQFRRSNYAGSVVLDPKAWKNKKHHDKRSLDSDVALALEAARASNQIFLEIPSKNRIIPFVFRPTDTINDLKAAIRKRGVWFDEEHHTLVFQKQKLPLDGERTLGDCGVEDRDTVLVYTHMPFVVCVYFPRKYVPPESFSFPVRVCCFDTIREVKVKIWRRLAVPVEQQWLRYNSTWLVDDSSRLLDYKVVGWEDSYTFFLFTSKPNLPTDLA